MIMHSLCEKWKHSYVRKAYCAITKEFASRLNPDHYSHATEGISRGGGGGGGGGEGFNPSTPLPPPLPPRPKKLIKTQETQVNNYKLLYS